MPADLSRRTLLGGVCAAVVTFAAGCRSSAGRRVVSPAATAPVMDLSGFVHDELRLIAACNAFAGQPSRATAIRHIRADHEAHLKALTPAGSGVTPALPQPGLAALIGLERRTARRAHRAAVTAADGGSAALLASIAASHSAHVELLS
jgi:hypothetical protein